MVATGFYFFLKQAMLAMSRQAHKNKLMTQIWEQIMGVDTKISSQYATIPQAPEAWAEKKFKTTARVVNPKDRRHRLRTFLRSALFCWLFPSRSSIAPGTKKPMDSRVIAPERIPGAVGIKESAVQMP